MAIVYGLIRESVPDEIRYVGISKYDDPSIRFNMHLTRKKNGHDLPVYDWMRKYDDVVYVVLSHGVSWEEAVQIEIDTIASLRKSNDRLLNMTSGGEGIQNMSQESIEKLRKASTGRTHTAEARQKMSVAKLGKSTWNKGKPWSAEARKKMSQSKIGVPVHTPESKKKLSEAGKRLRHTEEAKKKIGDRHRGKHVSEETRKKLSDAHRGRTPWNKGKKIKNKEDLND